MTVYAVAQFEIHDREAYGRYVTKFADVFKKYKGTLLVSDEQAMVLEGEWPKDKLVIMSFPDQTAFVDWAESPEYREIAKDRIAGSSGVVLLAEGFSPQLQQAGI